MLIFDRRREYDDLACAPRRQCKASRRRIHVCESSKLEAKPPDFDAQPRAMRFISVPRPKGACEERAPWDVRGPRFAQRACKSESSLKEKLIKIGAKVISHGRSIAFQMAEIAIPRQLFQEILRLIAELRPKPLPVPA
jgi:hypothetical protein